MNEKLDELVRDLTRVHSMAKSEVRKRLGNFLTTLISQLEELKIGSTNVIWSTSKARVEGYNEAISAAQNKIKEYLQ